MSDLTPANDRAETTPHFVLSHEGELHGQDSPENRKLVRRIEACVHACEGISTEELERGIVQDMRRVIAGVLPVLQAQKQALRNAGDAGRGDTAATRT